MGLGKLTLFWFVFFLMAFGLGYPTLNRYDARSADPDVSVYYKMTVGERTAPEDIPLSLRILVPGMARPFYRAAEGRLGSWNPAFFGLLVSNSMFAASAALLLLLIGIRFRLDLATGWLSCTILLLNFAVPNLWLSGLVDSSECCLLLAITYCLFLNRWCVLPLLGIVCAMAKQSTLPFGLILAATWWLTLPSEKRRTGQVLSIVGMGLAGTATLVLVYRAVEGRYVPPWTMAGWYNEGSYFSNIRALLVELRFWYPFVWLVPVGIWRIRRLPRPWVAASLTTAAFALFMAALAHLGGTVNRAVFNVIGPMLSTSAALFLTESRPDKSNSGLDT